MTNETGPHYASEAYWLGVRDARLGHAEMYPIRPFTSVELQAYRQGYGDRRQIDILRLQHSIRHLVDGNI